jgi:hypothetical protein
LDTKAITEGRRDPRQRELEAVSGLVVPLRSPARSAAMTARHTIGTTIGLIVPAVRLGHRAGAVVVVTEVFPVLEERRVRARAIVHVHFMVAVALSVLVDVVVGHVRLFRLE